MINFFQANYQLAGLPENQFRQIDSAGANDIGARSNMVVAAYALFLVSVLSCSAQIRNELNWVGPVGAAIIMANILRYVSGKSLMTAEKPLIGRYLKRYGLWSLISSLFLGLFAAFVLLKLGLTVDSIIVLMTVCGISGAAMGTMTLYANLWLSFLLLTWVPIIISCLYLGNQGHYQGYCIAAMGIVFVSFMVPIGRRLANEYWRGQITLAKLDERVQALTDMLERQSCQTHEIRLLSDRLQEKVALKTHDLFCAREDAERINKTYSTSLINMSHEMRTSLHAILTFSDFGRQNLNSNNHEKLGEYFDRIKESGGRLLTSFNNLLELSTLEVGSSELKPARTDLLHVLVNCIAEVEMHAREQALELEVLPPGCATTAHFDGNRMAQVITHLLTHIIQRTPSGKKVKLSIHKDTLSMGRRSTDVETGSALRFTIEGEDMGMSEEERQKMFDKCIHSHGTDIRTAGTRMELSICREIIESHRGKIWAEHERKDNGTRLHFTIPVGHDLSG